MISDHLIIEEQLCFALLSASSAVTRAMCENLEKLDITLTQYHVLIVLWRRDPIRMTNLACRLMVSHDDAQARVESLQQRGIVELLQDNRDADVTWVLLTNRGRRMQAEAVAARAAVAKRLSMSQAEFDQLPGQLMQLAGILEPDRANLARKAREADRPDRGLELTIRLGSAFRKKA